MSEAPMSLPSTCQRALEAIQADPLELPAAVQVHLRACPACSEARVLWLAQEEPATALAPAGYFERLPARVAGKLPVPRRTPSRRPLWLAAAAAMLALATGGGFWAGRINRDPLVEASQSRTPAEVKELQSDQPFQDKYEIIEQVQNLTPEEAQALLKQLESKDAGTKP